MENVERMKGFLRGYREHRCDEEMRTNRVERHLTPAIMTMALLNFHYLGGMGEELPITAFDGDSPVLTLHINADGMWGVGQLLKPVVAQDLPLLITPDRVLTSALERWASVSNNPSAVSELRQAVLRDLPDEEDKVLTFARDLVRRTSFNAMFGFLSDPVGTMFALGQKTNAFRKASILMEQSNGGDVDVQDTSPSLNGGTPLHGWASGPFPRKDSLELILRFGGNLGTTDSEGRTPLGLATQQLLSTMTRWGLPKTNFEDFHIAMAAIAMLREAGGQMDARDRSGHSSTDNLEFALSLAESLNEEARTVVTSGVHAELNRKTLMEGLTA